MAKTFRNLYEDITSFSNLHSAYLKARRGKRYTIDALVFSANLERSLLAIRRALLSRTYKTGHYRIFYVYEPKKREVAALPFRDRVVHHALINVIEPIWEARFIHDSYACRRGKGVHAGADRVTKFLRTARRKWPKVYVLKLDVKSYFPSVDHGILSKLLRRHVACEDTMWLIGEIIDSWPIDGGNKGIPIGNLTSQFFANVYLHELDIFVKHDLRAQYYVRYMDDAVIIHGDRVWLHEAKRKIGRFLEERLALRLNSKTNVFPAEQGINFLGYRIWWSHRLLRKQSVKRMRRKLRAFQRKYAQGEIGLSDINASVQSWLGHAKHANTYRLRRKVFGEFVLRTE